MKRQLSLVLALVMILGSFSAVFAAVPETANEKAAFLAEKGILKGNLEGDLNLTQDLKRRDALVVLSRLFDVEDEAQAYPAEDLAFTDINDAYYAGFIAWAVEEGYTDGKTETIYDPNGPLTAQQFATFLLRALQYQEDGENIFDKAFEEATKLGILEDVEVEKKDTVKRADMAAMTFNALGVKVKGTDKTLAETLGIEMPAPPKATDLKIEDVYTENLAEIVVELSNTELVKNQDALLNPANYRLNNDSEVEHVHLDGNNVILTLVPYGKVSETKAPVPLIKGKKFSLTIRNVDPKINTTKTGIEAKDNSIPEVVDVDFMGDYGIKVTTSEPIANPAERNFRLDSRTSMIIEQYGRDIILTPYHGKAFPENATELTIDKLDDFARYTSVRTVEDMKLSTDTDLPVVERTYRSGSKLVVHFDRDVYHKSVGSYENRRDLGNVSFVERRVTFYAKEHNKVDTNVVEYTFEREIPKNMEVVVEGVANHFNKEMEKDVRVPDEYKDDYAPVVIKSTEIVRVSDKDNAAAAKTTAEERNKGYSVSTKEMEIVFDKDIAQFATGKPEDVKVSDYFTLYELDITRRGKDAAEDVKIEVTEAKNDKIKLTFTGIKLNNKDRDYDYVLEVKDLSDFNGNRMDRDYLDFRVNVQGTDFDVKEVVPARRAGSFNRDGVEVRVVFNAIVNKEEASDERNYYLDNNLDVDEAIVERDGYTVSLVIYDTTVEKFEEKYKVLEISPRVIDNTANENSVARRFWDLKTGKAVTPEVNKDKEAADAVVALINDLPAVDEITLEDEDAVKAARAAYDALTAAQKELVDAEVLDALKAAEAKIDELEEEKEDEKEADVVLADGYVFELYGSSLGGFFQGKLVDNNNVVKDFSGYTIEIEEYGKANVSADGTIDVDITVDFVLSATGQSVLTVFDADGNLVGEGIEILKTN